MAYWGNNSQNIVATSLIVGDSNPILDITDTIVPPGSSSELVTSKAVVAYAAPSVILTTKGDLLTYDTAPVRLPVSVTNGQVLTTDSTTTKGVKWATPTGGIPNVLTTNGDLLTRIAGVYARYGVGSTNQQLTVVAGAPAWSSNNAAAVMTGVGDLLTTATANTLVRIPAGGAGYVLTSDGTNPSWQPQSAGTPTFTTPLTVTTTTTPQASFKYDATHGATYSIDNAGIQRISTDGGTTSFQDTTDVVGTLASLKTLGGILATKSIKATTSLTAGTTIFGATETLTSTAANQLAIRYDATHLSSFGVNSNGDLSITSTLCVINGWEEHGTYISPGAQSTWYRVWSQPPGTYDGMFRFKISTRGDNVNPAGILNLDIRSESSGLIWPYLGVTHVRGEWEIVDPGLRVLVVDSATNLANGGYWNIYVKRTGGAGYNPTYDLVIRVVAEQLGVRPLVAFSPIVNNLTFDDTSGDTYLPDGYPDDQNSTGNPGYLQPLGAWRTAWDSAGYARASPAPVIPYFFPNTIRSMGSLVLQEQTPGTSPTDALRIQYDATNQITEGATSAGNRSMGTTGGQTIFTDVTDVSGTAASITTAGGIYAAKNIKAGIGIQCVTMTATNTAGPQATLAYDITHYADLTVDNSGNLDITGSIGASLSISPQTGVLNTTDVSGTSASLTTAGGLYVAKKISSGSSGSFASGISVGSSGGGYSPTALSYFEQGTFTTSWTWGTNKTFSFTRIGNLVVLSYPTCGDNATANTSLDGTGLPTRFYPASQQNLVVSAQNGTTNAAAIFQIATTGGLRVWADGNYATFSTGILGVLNSGTISYMIV